jgi:U5 snRNP protein, DIM1 family
MFFFRNKHIMVDLGTGNNNKINWALDDKQEMIDLVEVLFITKRFRLFVD